MSLYLNVTYVSGCTVHLKRNEYETTVVQLVKALLEVDRLLKQQQDQASDPSTASSLKEAA